MTHRSPNRRDVLKTGSALTAAVLLQIAKAGFVFPDQAEDEQLVPFINAVRTGKNRLDWETLDQWLTPQDQVFSVQHYGIPEFDSAQHRLKITGMVDQIALNRCQRPRPTGGG